MKRLLALLLSAALALSLTACGKEDPPASSSSVPPEDAGTVSTPDTSGAPELPDTPDVSPEEQGDAPDVSPEEQADAPDASPEEHGDGPAITAAYAIENLPEHYINFREEPTEFDQGIVLRAETDVLGVRFFVVDYPADGGPETEGETLFTCDELKKGEELVIVTSFPGDMPSRGVSFDLGGQHEAYALTTSGRDGTLIMEPMGGVVPGY